MAGVGHRDPAHPISWRVLVSRQLAPGFFWAHDRNLAWLRVPIRHCDSAGQQSAWRDDEATEAAGRQLDIQPAFAVPAAARLVTGRAEPELPRRLAGSPRHARRVPRDDRRSANTPGQARFQSHTVARGWRPEHRLPIPTLRAHSKDDSSTRLRGQCAPLRHPIACLNPPAPAQVPRP